MNHEEAMRLLGPYLDGELDLTTCLKLEEHLASCPECRQKMEQEQALTSLVHEEAHRFQATPFLKTRIRASLREAEKSPSQWQHAFRVLFPVLALPLIGIIAILSSLFFPLSFRSSNLAREAVADHVRSMQVNHLMDVASTDQHTVKPWFAGKLDYSPQVVDLTSSGYPLIGGRLDVLDHRDVAAIVYQRRLHRINLFIWPAGSSAIHGQTYEQDGFHIIEWAKSGMNYLSVSDLNEKELSDFVKMIQNQTD